MTGRTRAWLADPCVCGHPRSTHVLRPRQPWPVTTRTYGRCGQCRCAALDLDTDAMAEAEAAVHAQRLAAWRADPLSRV